MSKLLRSVYQRRTPRAPVQFVHGENHAELRLAGHHLGVGVGCLLQRDCFDHGGDATERTEAERGVTRGRISGERAFKLTASKDKVRRRSLDRLRPDADDDGDAAWTQALEAFRHGLAAGSGDQNDLGAAKRLQGRDLIRSSTVDVVMSAELLRQLRLVGATGDCRDFKSHVAGVLHSEVAETADAEHRDKVAGLCRRAAQGAEGRESRAQQRRSIDRRKIVGNAYESAWFCDHHLGISAVVMNAGKFLIRTVHEIAIAAERAIAAGAGEKPYAYALAGRPSLDTGTERIDPPDDLMTRHPRPFDGKQSFQRGGVGMADATGLDPNSYLARARLEKRLGGFRELSRF